jgi:hypothetical protein
VDRFNLEGEKSHRYFISAYDRRALESPRTPEITVVVEGEVKARRRAN